MPDNNRIAELLTQLNEFVAQLKKPGGIPLHPDVPRALDAVAEILALIETPQLDLETIRQDIEALRQTLQEQGADLSLFRDKLGLMASQLEEVFNALADKLDVENAQNLIQQALNPISDAISALDIRLRDLEKMGQGNEGVGVEEAQALIETALAPIRDAIQQLKDREDPRIADLLQRVSDLENQTGAAAGMTLAQTQALIAEAVADIHIRIATLRSELEQKLIAKVAQTDFDHFKSQNQQALNAKASQSDLDATNAALAGKTDNADFEAFKSDAQQQLDAKASQSDLDATNAALAGKTDNADFEAFKSDAQQQLDAKADKTELAQCKADIEAELEKKADKDALDNHIQDTADKLDAKADKTELAQCKADIEAELEKKADKDALDNHIQDTGDKLDAKADKTELAQCKADIEAELEKKADKDDIVRIDNKLEELAQKWLDDAQNSPGARLARIALQGWGIVGGFDIRSDRKHYVHITPGIGVTPQGVLTIEPRQDNTGLVASGECTEEDLISGSLVFSHYQPFAYEGDCAFFHFEENCPIWEMLPPADDLPDEALPLTPQSEADKEQPFIVDKIILLLPDGDKRHYLLIRREDLLKRLSLSQKCKSKNRNTDYLFEEEYSPEDDFISDKDLWLCLQPAYGLPELSLYRFGFYQNEDCSPDELDVADFPKICSADDIYQTWKPIVDEALRHLTKAVKLLVERYRPLLFPLFNSNQYEKKLNLLTEKWVRFVKYNDAEGGGKGTKPYAQYFYDLARDLMAAYHELRSELIELMNDLRPLTLEMLAKERCFLMLGPALRPAACLDQAPLRDYFHQPPIYNGNANRLDTAKLYFCRLFAMIEGFYLPDYVPKSELPGWCQPDESHEEDIPVIPDFSRLRITPGRSYFYPLSEQTIPFYYPLNDNPKSLQHYWNYRRAKTLSADRLLSYHATDTPPNFPTYSRRRETLRPLHYTLDPHDFYRIEGHIGKTQVKLYGPANHNDQPQEHPVYDALVFLVQKYNLDFAVIRVSVSELQDFSCTQDNLYAIGDGSDPRESAWSFGRNLLGAEHLAGVPKGGTFILVTDDDGCAVADFSLPYRCCPPHDSHEYFSTRS